VLQSNEKIPLYKLTDQTVQGGPDENAGQSHQVGAKIFKVVFQGNGSRSMPHLPHRRDHTHKGGTIHSECRNSSLADGSEVENSRTIGVPEKVLFPELILRVQQ
jgi:hypothetical protein